MNCCGPTKLYQFYRSDDSQNVAYFPKIFKLLLDDSVFLSEVHQSWGKVWFEAHQDNASAGICKF